MQLQSDQNAAGPTSQEAATPAPDMPGRDASASARHSATPPNTGGAEERAVPRAVRLTPSAEAPVSSVSPDVPAGTSAPQQPKEPLPSMPGGPGLQGGFSIGRIPVAKMPAAGPMMPGSLLPQGRQAEGIGEKADGPRSFLSSLFLGSENEQRPDKSPLQAMRDAMAHKDPNDMAAQQGVVPGLFAAMDAPLHGLTPDDIHYASEVDAALARRPRFGARALSVSVAVMFAVLLVWAAFADIDEVTHAEGSVVGSQRTQTIQNLEGGILRAVMVHEGQIVEKGDVLAQLDNEMAESSYRDAVNKAMENTLAIRRLEAELRNETPVFPGEQDLSAWAAEIVGHRVDANIIERAYQIIKDQTLTWQKRQHQLNAEIEVLKSQSAQRRYEVEEQTARKLQLDRSLELSIEQRDAAYALVKRNNFSKMEYLGLQQKVVELQGQVDMLVASIPKAQAAAEEALQRITSRQAEQATGISEEINKRRLELTSLRETISAGGDRVTRTELRTPVRGTVKQIHINTVGGVVKPGEPIMDIVPLDDTLLVEARVSPKDVAFLRPGQEAMVKVSAYDFNIYGGLEGKLESISADTIEDKRGEHHYLVKVRTPETTIVYHQEVLPIIPGMIVTADILIGKKTVLDYLLKPILRAKQNALRER